MDTIKIRKEHPELMHRIRYNVQAYNDFTVDQTDENPNGDSMHTYCRMLGSENLKSASDVYYTFIELCFLEDIRELQQLIESKEEK